MQLAASIHDSYTGIAFGHLACALPSFSLAALIISAAIWNSKVIFVICCVDPQTAGCELGPKGAKVLTTKPIGVCLDPGVAGC